MAHAAAYARLERLGRERLSRRSFFREFLYSEIAAAYGMVNVPDDEEIALKAGRGLCEHLLEPLADRFGRIHIRSGYRSCAVNALGNANDHNCARNEANYARHIWDVPDQGAVGATACVVVPAFYDVFSKPGDWTELAWWIPDHLPFNTVTFFKRDRRWAFNINWREGMQQERRIESWEGRFEDGSWTTKRLLTKNEPAGDIAVTSSRYARLEARLPL